MTQRELAERSGVSVATLRKIQQGDEQRRSTVTLAAISRTLGFADDYLRRVSTGEAGDSVRAATSTPTTLARLQDELSDLRQRVEAIEARFSE